MRAGVFAVAVLVAWCVLAVGVAADPCDLRPSVDGCSIPFDLPFFYKNLFTPACLRHDICYGCGAEAGISRDRCDQVLKANMKALCDQSGRSDIDMCKNFAEKLYFVAVRLYGQSRYLPYGTAAAYCVNSAVSSCLP